MKGLEVTSFTVSISLALSYTLFIFFVFSIRCLNFFFLWSRQSQLNGVLPHGLAYCFILQLLLNGGMAHSAHSARLWWKLKTNNMQLKLLKEKCRDRKLQVVRCCCVSAIVSSGFKDLIGLKRLTLWSSH